MKNKNNLKYVFAVIGILALVFLLVFLPVFVQGVGAGKIAGDVVVPAAVSDGMRTYLFLGKDRASGLTDVMMLVGVDTAKKKAAVLQIPRDTYAVYAENGYRKLNGALSLLGADGLCAFLSESMGVPINGYFVVDLDAFVKAVDMLGGVEIDIPEGMYYRDDDQGLDIALESGRQTLDGKAAENFVRYRSGYLRGDLGRIDAQKLFITALLQKVKSTLTPAKAVKLASSLAGDVKTNVSFFELSELVISSLDIDDGDILLATLSGEDVRSGQSGAWFYVLSKSSAKEVVNKLFCTDSEFDKNGVFRNIQNSDFERIYYSSVEHNAKTLKDIAQNGIEIEKR